MPQGTQLPQLDLCNCASCFDGCSLVVNFCIAAHSQLVLVCLVYMLARHCSCIHLLPDDVTESSHLVVEPRVCMVKHWMASKSISFMMQLCPNYAVVCDVFDLAVHTLSVSSCMHLRKRGAELYCCSDHSEVRTSI